MYKICAVAGTLFAFATGTAFAQQVDENNNAEGFYVGGGFGDFSTKIDELDDIDDVDTIGHWVGGKAVAGTSGRVAPVYDPARGTQTAQVALASAAEVDDVVKVAVDASLAWGESSLSRRAGART